MAPKKTPDPVDVHVGGKMRARRVERKMGQKELGLGLGVSAAQVQKYESGENRLGASMLQKAARLLEVDPSFFFNGAPGGKAPAHPLDGLAAPIANALGLAGSDDALRTALGLRGTKALLAIKDLRVLAAVVNMLEAAERTD